MLDPEEPYNSTCTTVWKKKNKRLLQFPDYNNRYKVDYHLFTSPVCISNYRLAKTLHASVEHIGKEHHYFYRKNVEDEKTVSSAKSVIDTAVHASQVVPHIPHSADFLANKPLHWVLSFGLHICLVHHQQAKKNHPSSEPPEKCELLTKQRLAENSGEEKVRRRVGHCSLQGGCAKSQCLCKYCPHDSIAGDH